MNKNQHGGKRTPTPGKKLGRPPQDLKLRIIKIQCTSEELDQILRQTPDTRQRALRLLEV